ncbi:CDP-glycerol glycerophosphotransferase family protein [Lishizhenia sp.]|uniref:CDP-glycerol glycerophosphotransferase family protein n=1 Tax=Lishizhenia sp. TaxID=2497594 RepID=UPI00299D8343|nr:CDP-glycerol glycerophosphotransferase family protein [Lishizhenia sp.]MDX1446887.1 CDP-glycerol glycerophosphotransferase family protein [Lishizhenia sp.]
MEKRIRRISKFISSGLDALFSTKKHIVFGCRSAKGYADNSKYLYEYFLDQGEKVYFFTKKKELMEKIPGHPLYAYHWKTPFIMMRAKVLVMTHGAFDFFPYFFKPNKKRWVLNLFHAIPVKKIEAVNGDNLGVWDNFVVSSEIEKEFTVQNMQMAPSSIIVAGQARNDKLKRNNFDLPKEKKILFAPTFRDTNITQLFPFKDKDLKALDKLLNQLDVSIAVRLHINEESVYKKEGVFEGLKNIYFEGSNIYPDVNEVLSHYSAVITDYSSVYLDFLLLDRPVAFIPYDYDEYEKIRGFSFPYFENTPGPKISKQSELETFIQGVAKNKNPYQEEAQKIKHKFHQETDGKVCENLYTIIKKHARSI